VALEEIYYVSQILSTLALVVSVIYLGRQTHLAGKNQVAQMHQARSEQFHEYTLKLTDPEFGPLARAAFHASDALDDEQIYRFYFYASTVLRFFEEMYRQWQDGMIATTRWQTTEKSLAGILRAPGYRATYKALRGTLDTGFVRAVDDLLQRDRDRPAINPVQEWKEAMAEDKAQSTAPKHAA
jgi:hypothetical protein